MRHWQLVAELEDLFKGKKRHEGEGTWRRKDGSEWRYGADGRPERVKKGRKKADTPKPKGSRTRKKDDNKAKRFHLVDEDVEVSWDEMARDNDADIMDELATLKVGQHTVFGMSDRVKRIS